MIGAVVDVSAAARFHEAFDERHGDAPVRFTGDGALPSAFAVTDLAAGSIAAATSAVRRLVGALGGGERDVAVDRRLASLWFAWTLRPDGWTVPPPWDAVAGDYRGADGWIKLHTNAPHHRAAALGVLGVEADRVAVAAAVGEWSVEGLERAVVDAGGCAAAMRSSAAWAVHEQGSAVAAEPILHRSTTASADRRTRRNASPDRPLAGVRVLDLTRVLAGPVATRFLAGLGADVLRIDPLDWDEPGVVPEVTLGKRLVRLDLRSDEGAVTVRRLLADADVLVHGYRPGALAHLGLDVDARTALAPGLVDVSLCAYGHTGPWRDRRGFDSLVQMSCGIAEAGMVRAGTAAPAPLPVQALDHATGYLLAMAAIDGWCDLLQHGTGTVARASLARTAALLISGPEGDLADSIAVATSDDEEPVAEQTTWGRARRLRPPADVGGVPLHWDRGARALGADTDRPNWSQ